MFRIRRFGVIRTATVAAAMYFVVTLLIFLLIAAVFVVFRPALSRFPGDDRVFLPDPSLFLVSGIIGAVVYGIVGWIFTALACLLYNLVARFTGGIEVEVQRVEPPAMIAGPPGWGQQPPPAGGPPGWGPQQPPAAGGPPG